MKDLEKLSKTELIAEIKALQKLQHPKVESGIEIKLAESEENLKLNINHLDNIFDNIGDPIFVKDEHSRLLLVNDAFCTVFDLSRDEIIGKTLADDVSEKERENFLKIDKQVLADGIENNQIESLTLRGGETKVIRTIKTRFIDDKNEKYLVGIIHDVTEQKKTEAELNQNSHLLNASQSIAKVGGWELDVATNHLFWTAETYRIHETTPEEFNPTVDAGVNYFLPESRNIISKALELAIKDGVGYYLELETLTTKGRLINVRTTCEVTQVEGKPTKLTGIFQDITKRKAVEKDISLTNKKYESLFEDSPVPLWEEDITELDSYIREVKKKGCTDLESYFENNPNELIKCAEMIKVLNVNQAALKLHRAKSRNHLIENLPKTFSKNSIVVFKKEMLALAEGKEKFESEAEVKTLEGDLIHISLSLKIDRPKPGIVRALLATPNISERKRAEEELIESEERFNNIINQSIEGTSITDENGKVIIWNNAMEEITGFSPAQIINKNIWDVQILLLPEEARTDKARKQYKNMINDLLRTGKSAFTGKVMEREYVQPDGNKIIIQGIIKTVKTRKGFVLVSTTTDITKQRAAEKLLKESEERFELAMTAAKDGLYDWNLLTNEIYYSPGWKNMLGYKDHELPNDFAVWEKLINPIDAERSWKMQKEVIEKKRDRFELEFKMKHKNGQFIDILSRAEMVFDENGIPTRMIGTHVDISDRKLMENELINAKEKAEESDRLKSAFLSNMSHEIRTPMNGILGFSELLKKPNLSGEDQRKYISVIQKSGDRMLNIINDIISISKIESGLMQVHLINSNINEQIEFIYNFFKPEVERKGLKFSFNTPLPAIEAYLKTDREKVYAVLTNLVKNAIKFTSEGSLEFGYQIKNEFFEFYIKDTGIGIPKNRQNAIFERFIQADIEDAMAYQGAGLGLSISSAYVKMLGGEIWVESQEGKGSSFYFTLPLDAEKLNENKKNSEIEKSNQPAHEKKLKMLIAEDDEASEQLISIYVSELADEIVNVRTGIEAVSACQKNPDIDVILMDVLMPEMDGLEATRKIREFNKEVIIIAQTAYGMQGDREKALSAGCNDYISKPIKKTELLSLINSKLSDH